MRTIAVIEVVTSIYTCVLTDPPLDRHTPFFTGKYFPSTGTAETERFVWLARDHTLYPGSWSKWKLLLNKITSGDVQQTKQWTWKLSLPLETKWSLITVCKSGFQARSKDQVAGQWWGDTTLTLPLFWRQSTVSPVFFRRFPRSSLHSFVPFPLCPRS